MKNKYLNKYLTRKSVVYDPFQHREHNKNLLMVHLIFVTKYRKLILFGKLRDKDQHCLAEP